MPPKNLATSKVLLPLAASSPEFLISAKKPSRLMESIKVCNRTPESHALLKLSLYDHIKTITYENHKELIHQLTPDFPNLGEHTIFWRTLAALRLYQGQLLRTHVDTDNVYNFLTDAITFGEVKAKEGSLQLLIEARDPIAVTILLLHGANPGASIGMCRKDLPLNYAYFLYTHEFKEKEEEKSKLESIMAVLFAFYRGSHDPVKDEDLEDHYDLRAFLKSPQFQKKVSEVRYFLNELEQEQTLRLACQTDSSIIFGKIPLWQLLDILTNKSRQPREADLPKFLGITFTADFLKKHLNLWLPQYMRRYKITEEDKDHLKKDGSFALLKTSVEENNYFLATAFIKINRELQVELSTSERNELITTVLTTYRNHLVLAKGEEAISDDFDNYTIARLDAPNEITLETLQRYQQTLELQAEVVVAKDQWVTAKSKLADLRLKHAETRKISAEELKEAEENVVIEKDSLRASHKKYRTHLLSGENEQSSLIELLPHELALKFLSLFCDTLQPTIHLSVDHWKLLREAPLRGTLLFKDCLQHRSQNGALGDYQGRLDITTYEPYSGFQESPQIHEAFKVSLKTANGLTANAFIHKMHQLIQQRFLVNAQAIDLALQLFKEVMVGQGISAMMIDPSFDKEDELLETLKLAFSLWPGIIDAKLDEQSGDHFIHHTLGRYNRLGLAEALITWGCNVVLTNDESQVPHFMLSNLKRLANAEISTSDVIRIKRLEELCRDKAKNQQAVDSGNFGVFYKYQYLPQLEKILPQYNILISSLEISKYNIRQIYEILIKEISNPTSQTRSVDSNALKEALIATFPKKDKSTIRELNLKDFDDMGKFLESLETIKILSAENNFEAEIPLCSQDDIEEFRKKNAELFIAPPPLQPQDQTALENLINKYRIKLSIEGQDYLFYIDEYFTVQDIFRYLQIHIPSLQNATLQDLSLRLGILLDPDLKTECLTHLEATHEDGQIMKGHLVAREFPTPKDDTNTKVEKKPSFFDRMFSRTASMSSVTTSVNPSQSPPANPSSKANPFSKKP